MRVAAVVVKQRTILATIMNDTDGANLNTSRGGGDAQSSKPLRRQRARKNRVEFNSVRSGVVMLSPHRTHLEDVAIPRQIDVKSASPP